MQGGVDFAAVRASAQRDLLNPRLDHFRRLITTLRFIERFRQPLDLFSDRYRTRSDGCPEYPIVPAPEVPKSCPSGPSNSRIRSVMPRVCPPSSITVSICFKVRWKFASSELDAGDDARVISP